MLHRDPPGMPLSCGRVQTHVNPPSRASNADMFRPVLKSSEEELLSNPGQACPDTSATRAKQKHREARLRELEARAFSHTFR